MTATESIIRRAGAFAAARHAGQLRKGSSTPYFVHPAGVARILAEHYADAELVAAGYLHDVLEDTPTTRAELEATFGRRVAELVSAVTKQRGQPWRLPAVADVARLKAADALDNMRATRADLAIHGDKVWARFKGGEPTKRRYYAELVGDIAAVLGDEPLVRALAAENAGLFGPHRG